MRKVIQEVLQTITLMVLPFLTLSVEAVTFVPSYNEAAWQADGSVFECKLSHDIPYYGTAVFYRRAGEMQSFFLEASSARMKSGKASLQARAPDWKEGVKDKNLGFVPVTQGRKPVNLGQQKSDRMLSELFQGYEMVLTRRPWYGAERSIDVAMSPIQFRAAYASYQDCLSTLLPVNFDQISRTPIYFPSGSEELHENELRKLDNVVLYVNADPSVQAFYIDGHTDSNGARNDNLELSKMRAEMVAQYLTSRGVDASKITSRWHGERYPVKSNRSRSGRAQNRRVTIRLDRLPAAKETQSPSVAQQI